MINRMKASKRKHAKDIQNSIRQILFNDWDPISINDNSNLVDEYDSVITPIYRILVGSRSQEQVIECLKYSSEELCGKPNKSSDFYVLENAENELKRIAEKLLELDVKI